MRTPSATRQTRKILIIEDEPDICLLLNIMLKKDEVELEHVKSLEAGKKFLAKEVPSLVILDNKLPDGLGLDFILYIRNRYPTVRIVMISGYHAAAIKDVALFNGADHFIEKPFTKEQIYQAVQSLLQKETVV